MEKRPNILFVFADQWRYSALGSSGNQVVRTPNLDRLADEGLVFDEAHSSCPLCSPYRGQLLTGRYSHANGVLDNEYKLKSGQATLPGTLGAAGYRTGFIGKWHLGYGPYPDEARHGFDYLAAYNCGYGFNQTEYHLNEEGPFPFNDWSPAGETDLAIRFMQERTRDDAPFALVVGWAPPHWPYDQYPESFNTYRPEDVDPPPNVPRQMEQFARKELADYYGIISALDHQMGRLLDAVERLKIAENTIVVFTSDHGDHLSSHGYGKPMDRWLPPYMRASKATPYEESIHVPFILRTPGGAPEGSRSRTLLSSVDIMPTLLGLCGVEVPEGVQGTDLSPVVRGEEMDEPDSVYLQILGEGWPHRGRWVGFWRGLRTRRWVYARWKDDEHGPWLFDRDADPHEMKNLAGRPEFADDQRSLEARLQRWIGETNDPFETGERDPATGMLMLGQEFVHEKYRPRAGS